MEVEPSSLPPETQFANLHPDLTPLCKQTPVEIRDLILDYLLFHGRIDTASQFASQTMRPSAAAYRMIQLARHRQQIGDCIRSGRIIEALALLREHFASALTDLDVETPAPKSTSNGVSESKVPYTSTASIPPTPVRSTALPYAVDPILAAAQVVPNRILHLDLLMQDLVESIREASITITSMPSNGHLAVSVNDSLSVSSSGSTASSSAQAFSPALLQAQQLFATASRLSDLKQRQIYQKEMQDVSALFLYKDLATSPLAHLIDPNRRAELAARVDRACLGSVGCLETPAIETVAVQTTAVWQQLSEQKQTLPGRTSKGTDEDSKDAKADKIRIRGFDLQHFLEDHSA